MNALCLCFVPLYLSFLALGCLVSSLSVYKLHCDSQYRAGCCQCQLFYGEKLKQAVYEPRPRDKRDRHIRTHVHCENRSLIQSLTLMRSAISSHANPRKTHVLCTWFYEVFAWASKPPQIKKFDIWTYNCTWNHLNLR